ncbi:MAG: GTPase Era [Chitinispirillia bacterium]|nr:GTPase Era [Chitinispirillia bacterium]MCL2242340.1 GTPase Era [Chitinispirillia bacterium]
MDITNNNQFRSAFIALFGRPNSGKSTLMNTVLQETISIVTSLPQTTRQNIKGIYSEDNLQIVFVDTPGMHKGKHTLNEMMREQAVSAVVSGVDLICYLVDLSRDFGDEESDCAACAASSSVPVLLVFNKVDLCGDVDGKVKAFLSAYKGFKDAPMIKISASSPKSKEIFLAAVNPLIPEGPKYFDDDSLTDASMRTIAAEFIRKQVIVNTREEVPHAVFVEIEEYRETPQKHEIVAGIHVETQGQKGIIIGSKGALIDKIKKFARRDIENLVGGKVSLKLHVKVTPGWRDDSNFLRGMQ